MKKRILALLIAACITTGLAGCKSEPEEEPGQDVAASETITDPGENNAGTTLVMGQPIEQEDYTMTPIYCRTTDVAHAMHQDSDYAMHSSGENYFQSDFLMKFTIKKSIDPKAYDVANLIRVTAENNVGEKFATDTENTTDVHLIKVKEDFYNGVGDYTPKLHYPIDNYYLHYIIQVKKETNSVDYIFHVDNREYTYHFDFN